MYKLTSLIALLMVLLIGTLVSCSGGNPATEIMDPANLGVEEAPAVVDEGMPELPMFPFDDPAEVSNVKGASWVSSVNPQAPGLAWKCYNCGTHAQCLVLDGTFAPPLTHVPKGPHWAYAIYKVPMGASASDLLELKIEGAVEAPGQMYYLAISNFSAMHWEWFGPGTGDYSVDYTTLPYDVASAIGDTYIAVVAPVASVYHLWDINLIFADDPDEEPEWWNVWGQAYNYYPPTGAAPIPMPGETVTFENLGTGVIYNTITAANGAWGFNLPTGHYKFYVSNQDVLFDPVGWTPIEDLAVELEINMGDVIYHGSNAVYAGTIVGSPIITTNDY